ncbi:solute carrier family 25 member 53 [Rhinatrema bivittatum]|uniref:solute carrier family 25 member 53 n=1 Tax=Rhinatrema bivittatum TaxID=194408 RepID=UPI00112E7AF0|nr:solute carrier family 25 member 53 [Rhinatrema bivittatum]
MKENIILSGEAERQARGWSSSSYVFGAVSSFLSTFVTFPIYKTIFRQQIHVFAMREAVHQLRQEGLRRFYRGVLPPLVAKTVQGTLLFGTYDTLLHLLSTNPSGPYKLRDRWKAGFLSGSLEAVVLSPFERVQNIMQDGRKNARFPDIHSIVRQFNSCGLKEGLTTGYYRGFSLILLRNTLGSALYFSFKDPIRDSLSSKGLPSWLPPLVSGSVNGTMTCLLLYPLSVLIANMQSQVGKESLSLAESMRFIWESRGKKLSLIYRGGSLLILRSCVTWGLTTAIHDFLQGGDPEMKRRKE